MSALHKLQEKIEQWKTDHEALKVQNTELKNQLESTSGIAQGQELLKNELETKNTQCIALEENLRSLKRELEEKDNEIEKIIAQVEALLG